MSTRACTFTPLSRNRFRCNSSGCRTKEGKQFIVKRDGIETHHRTAFARENPRVKMAPAQYAVNRSGHSLSGPKSSSRTTSSATVTTQERKTIGTYAELWYCRDCAEINPCMAGHGLVGFVDEVTCADCGRKYELWRDQRGA